MPLRQYKGPHDGVDLPLPDGRTLTAYRDGDPIEVPEDVARTLPSEDWTAPKPAAKKAAPTDEKEQ